MSERLPADVFVDTSFWFATLEPKDTHFERAGEIWRLANRERTRMHCTRDIVSETLTLLRYRASARAALVFLEKTVPEIHVIDPPREYHEQAMALFRWLAPKRRVSYCDVLSFVVVRVMLRNVACLTFDSDFTALGLTVIA